MILVYDNFDSFTYNLVDYIEQQGQKTSIITNNTPSKTINIDNYKGIIISPGPGTPESSGELMEFMKKIPANKPLLGVCLGHQALNLLEGGTLTKAKQPMHGKVSNISIDCNSKLFKNFNSNINVVRYHSLIINKLGNSLDVISFNKEEEIMAVQHKTNPWYGVQFHPESILTEFGHELIANWIAITKKSN